MNRSRAVQAAFVGGLPDAQRGQLVGCLVCPEPDADIDPTELTGQLRQSSCRRIGAACGQDRALRGGAVAAVGTDEQAPGWLTCSRSRQRSDRFRRGAASGGTAKRPRGRCAFKHHHPLIRPGQEIPAQRDGGDRSEQAVGAQRIVCRRPPDRTGRQVQRREVDASHGVNTILPDVSPDSIARKPSAAQRQHQADLARSRRTRRTPAIDQLRAWCPSSNPPRGSAGRTAAAGPHRRAGPTSLRSTQ